MRVLTYTVPPEDEGLPVRRLLRGRLALSYTRLKSLKWQENAILLNGQPCTVAAIAHSGDVLTVNVTDTGTRSPHIIPVDVPLDILWEDDDLLIIHKPAGIAVHSAALTEETVTIAGMAAHYLAGSLFHPVNRLDKGVSGIMVIAKSGHIHDLCMRILHTDDFRREYRGICLGTPCPSSGVIELPIGRENGSAIRRCIDPQGLPSRSDYEVLQSGTLSLLRLRPLTGRTHQLRVHCAAIGHPLAGDWLYGTEDNALIARIALHSYELWLRHPISGETLHITDPLPQDMRDLL